MHEHKLLYTEWINIKILLCSAGSYSQCPVINHNGKEYGKKNVYSYRTESRLYTVGINTTL